MGESKLNVFKIDLFLFLKLFWIREHKFYIFEVGHEMFVDFSEFFFLILNENIFFCFLVLW